MALRIYTGARGSQFVCDNTRAFGDAIAAISVRADAPVNSCAREKAAEPLLHRIGKMSQAELYACSLHCTASCHGNCNPANPPGRSTHERRNDGVAYPVPAGVWLRYWQRGIDVQRDRVNVFCAEARKEGWTITATYPGSAAEAQHVNFRKAPRISLWEFLPVKHGSRGRRAREVIRRLKAVLDPETRRPYLNPKLKTRRVGTHVDHAIRQFQHDHHQKADGVVGVHTIRALRHADKAPARSVSAAGIDFIASFEGLRLEAYHLPGEQYWTIGYGHYGPDVKPGMKITKRRARELLVQDVDSHTARLRTFPAIKRQREFDGFGSACFNLGPGVLDTGRSLGDALRAKVRPIRKAADSLLLYVNPGTPVEAGLRRRRKAERQIVLAGDYSTD